jgi:hypothetical protein
MTSRAEVGSLSLLSRYRENQKRKGRILVNQLFSKIRISLMTLGLLCLVVAPAAATPRPFHLVEHGTIVVDANGNLLADGSGTATHLGHFTIHRTGTLKPSGDGPNLIIEGHATLTASNGDLLETDIEGVLDPATGRAVLTYEWEGGTGRFQNATGSATWLVQVNPDGTYDVVADGILNI